MSRYYIARTWPLWVVPIAYYALAGLLDLWLFRGHGSDALRCACGLGIAIASCLEREPGRRDR